jgi:hypothetical protein
MDAVVLVCTIGLSRLRIKALPDRNLLIEKESPGFKELELVQIEKAGQLFRNML